ncbi:MAG: methyltransferase domain-containing protein [Acidimicrobiales bacterium]|jgi:protein arginine N-methyltransferase 1
MRKRVSDGATRALRSAIGFGAAKLASNDRLMGAIYDLKNEANFSGLSEHEEMLNDAVRVNTYHRGIQRCVKPGDVVLDLGTGSGLLALMASQAGAAKVYAVDHSDFIEVARDIARHNNITNIEFVQINSREFTPAEPIDVLLHEQMGDELFNENMLENLLDLRSRVLRPGGRILPARFRLFVEPVTFHESMRVRRFWNIELPDGIDLSSSEQSAGRFDSGRMEQLWVRPGSVAATLNTPEPVLEFDLHTLDGFDSLAVDHVVKRKATADVIVDGFCIWFEAIFDDETTLTTSPLAPITSWGNRLFRFDTEVAAGETMRCHVHLGELVEPSTWTVERL